MSNYSQDTLGVLFNADTHTYYRLLDDSVVVPYTSVTQCISMFKPIFDVKRIAKAYAQKHGQTADYWIKLWEKIKTDAAEKGKQAHLLKEQEVLATRPKQALQQKEIPLASLPDGKYPEIVVYNHDYRIAGTIDLLTIQRKNDINTITITDYKTSKAINQKGFQGQRMLEPLSYLEDCNYNHYALQLSLYAYILENYGFTIENLYLLHLKENEEVEYLMPYMRNEAELMLKKLSYVIEKKESNARKP